MQRDGHTGIIYQGMLIVFGGDRHYMSFNDTYIFNIQSEIAKRGFLDYFESKSNYNLDN